MQRCIKKSYKISKIAFHKKSNRKKTEETVWMIKLNNCNTKNVKKKIQIKKRKSQNKLRSIKVILKLSTKKSMNIKMKKQMPWNYKQKNKRKTKKNKRKSKILLWKRLKNMKSY